MQYYYFSRISKVLYKSRKTTTKDFDLTNLFFGLYLKKRLFCNLNVQRVTMEILDELKDWEAKFPRGEGFPTAGMRDFIQKVISEIEKLKGQVAFLEKQLDILEISIAADDDDEVSGCPCRFTEPCHPNCTCVKPHSSKGCRRCCSYGNTEQRKLAAERIVKLEHN